jgi:polygalacturonase
MGTDVGLRFKSTRGRGGVVENIYIDNIQMINIPTECLLFDLYYSGKSASEMLAEGNTAPKEETIPEVTEETPAFRNIYISRIACRNARRAMYFNGLPEMPITNINVTDARISSTLGVELCESDGVKLENVAVTVSEGPALSLTNVKNLVATDFEYAGTTTEGLSVAGERAGQVQITSKSLTAGPKNIAAGEALVQIAE